MSNSINKLRRSLQAYCNCKNVFHKDHNEKEKKYEGSDIDEEYDSEECNLVGGYNDYKESD